MAHPAHTPPTYIAPVLTRDQVLTLRRWLVARLFQGPARDRALARDWLDTLDQLEKTGGAKRP